MGREHPEIWVALLKGSYIPVSYTHLDVYKRQVLRSLYRAYIDLKGKFDRLQGDYDRVREGNARLSDRLMEVKMENKKLRQISADYTRVKLSLIHISISIPAASCSRTCLPRALPG